ncbi:hypothetical protein [Sorangium sp. So ce1153]|uniref:hypothetical protein n=1 Tax=Sorangium sp. So ce1153 TaxID=3133333 RepID=UPI003F61B690
MATANEHVYTPGAFPTIDQRMLEVTITNTLFEGLRFFALHLPGRRDLPDGKRDGPLAVLASAFHAAWKGGPVVLAGDFNADPYHREIAARGYFWAVRDRSELSHRRVQRLPSAPGLDVVHSGKVHPAATDLRALVTLADRSPLYNPMWKWLPERRKHPRGTHYYLDDDCGISWHCYDQILLSPELVEHVQDFRVLSKLGKTNLIEGDQKKPIETGYSDHLPVTLVLDRH